MKPMEIEKESFAIITRELGDKKLLPGTEEIVKRVIHCTADFDYADNLVFSENVVPILRRAFSQGCDIVTDTMMARAGISKAACEKLGIHVHCFIADADVAKEAKERGITRAAVAMERAAALQQPCVFAIGNAPTAILSLLECVRVGKVDPIAVIGVPVGFVNVCESKEALCRSAVPHIVAMGRKGGSNVAAAICNAILYSLVQRS